MKGDARLDLAAWSDHGGDVDDFIDEVEKTVRVDDALRELEAARVHDLYGRGRWSPEDEDGPGEGESWPV